MSPVAPAPGRGETQTGIGAAKPGRDGLAEFGRFFRGNGRKEPPQRGKAPARRGQRKGLRRERIEGGPACGRELDSDVARAGDIFAHWHPGNHARRFRDEKPQARTFRHALCNPRACIGPVFRDEGGRYRLAAGPATMTQAPRGAYCSKKLIAASGFRA